MGAIKNLLHVVKNAALDKIHAIWVGKDYDYRYIRGIKLLIAQGLTIGKNVRIEHGVVFDAAYPYLISIGDNCALAEGVRLMAHDDTTYLFNNGFGRLGKIEIRENCFIGERSIILPGVTIGPNVLVAAGSVVNKDIPSDACVAGVPARFYGRLSELLKRNEELIKTRPIFMYSDLRSDLLDPRMRESVKQATMDGICYVKGKEGTKFNYLIWNRGKELQPGLD